MWLAAKIQPVLVAVQVVASIEIVQQGVPVLRQGQQLGPDHFLGGNVGEALHGMIPHQNLAIFTY